MNYIEITQVNLKTKTLLNKANICSIDDKRHPIFTMTNGEKYVCEESYEEVKRQVDE